MFRVLGDCWSCELGFRVLERIVIWWFWSFWSGEEGAMATNRLSARGSAASVTSSVTSIGAARNLCSNLAP